MRVYVKSVAEDVVLVDIDSGERFTVAPATFERLFRVMPEEGMVFQVQVSRLEDVAEMFRRWQEVVSQA